MIQANELRIGNRILAPNGEEKQVVNIQPNSINQLSDGDGVTGAFLLERYNGIILTSDILYKCGFRWQELEMPTETLNKCAYKETPICAYYDGVEWCFKYGHDSDLTIAACEYLHQLQNLIYALTGEELTITPSPQ